MDPGPKTALPKLCDRGHVLIFSRSYLQTTGSAVVVRNLLAQFDPASYTLVVSDLHGPSRTDPDPGVSVHALDVTVPGYVPGRWQPLWKQHEPFIPSRVNRLARSLSPAVIVGIYPDVEFLSFARGTAKDLRIPWLAYIHDTIVEVMDHTQYAAWAKALQPQVFSEVSSMFVMGDLERHYTDKYSVPSKTLPIAYPEPMMTELPEDHDVRRQAFTGGSVYVINARSMKRVLTALEELKCPLVLRTTSTDEVLKTYGITGEYVRRESMGDRAEYLETLQHQGLLLIHMDWPDESKCNPQEMATILPTKATEYTASGRPILVHCPEDYYLAKFFLEHKCGIVVSERDQKALVDAISRLLKGGEDVFEMRRAALATARTEFSMERVALRFRQEVNAVAQLKWAEKIPAA